MSKMPLAKWPSLDEAEKRVQNIVFRSPGSEAKDIATGRVRNADSGRTGRERS